MSINLLAKSVASGLAVALALTITNQTVHAQSAHRYPGSQPYVTANQREIPVATPVQTAPGNYSMERSVVQAGGQVAGNGQQPVGSGVARSAYNELNFRQQAAQPVPQNNQLRSNAGLVSRPQYTPGNRVVPASYTPRHMRTAQMVSEVPLSQDPVTSPAGNNGQVVFDEAPMYEDDMMIGQSYVDSGGDCGSCNSCVSGGCGIGCDRGGCSPELIGDCWLSGLGGLLYRADYFGGAACWDSPTFQDSQSSDYNGGSGFYAGTNIGIPLCRITCGLASGQLGVRTVQSEISGSPNINQMFVTGGFYRRVDHGIQFGVVADYLKEDFLFEAEVIQVRGDLSWVYMGGNALGFRFAKGIQDDWVPEFPAGVTVPPQSQFRLQTLDNYRMYYRTNCESGGYSDVFFGWTDDSQVVGGMDLDMPLTECMMVQAGATYALPTASGANVLGGNSEDAWNIYVGFAYRPQGRCWYQNYDRPILPVADNGSMMLRRGF